MNDNTDTTTHLAHQRRLIRCAIRAMRLAEWNDRVDNLQHELEVSNDSSALALSATFRELIAESAALGGCR